ncbi:hypothetical protein KFE25_012347 [Diacronema lutheri]|mgnify:CR=1 FL=1|uniref:Cyclin N-terminal domain-containing protein n=1 Tax=Diacronema lutheri TaxID=2081491 RepID=A0A8J5XL09_DIALT|nr:hypothetical protein KFE25_012347 [Diacronema lutheri]
MCRSPRPITRACALALHAHVESALAVVGPSPLPHVFHERLVAANVDGSTDVPGDAEERRPPPYASLAMTEALYDAAASALNLGSEVLVCSIILIERVMRAVGVAKGPVRMCTVRHLLAAALTVAAKFLGDECDDTILIDVRRALVMPSATTLAECELELLHLVNFDVVVAPALYSTYVFALIGVADAYEPHRGALEAPSCDLPRAAQGECASARLRRSSESEVELLGLAQTMASSPIEWRAEQRRLAI